MTLHTVISRSPDHTMAKARQARPLASLFGQGISKIGPASSEGATGALRTTVHVIFESASDRAQAARKMFALGHHAEVYSTVEEFLAHAPCKGVAFIHEDNTGSGAELVSAMRHAGFWLPVIAWGNTLDCDIIVQGVKSGVLDFVVGNLDDEMLRRKIRTVVTEGATVNHGQHRFAVAQRLVSLLTGREREVLEQLAEGHSNKEMARQLEISPRTIEIHRMKMMGKLGARSPADAIRIKLEADRVI